MDGTPLTSMTQSPFAALSFVAAPALLTNASSVLAMSTINRMLRTRDTMRELMARSNAGTESAEESQRLVNYVNRVERQATLLLRALHSIYVALAAFASATLVTLLGTGLAPVQNGFWTHLFAGIGVALGFVGVGGLVFGCVSLFRATQLSIIGIRDDAALIRERHGAVPRMMKDQVRD